MRAAILSAGIVLLLALSGCASSPSPPPATLLGKIPGCTGIQTEPGSAYDDNTAAEGSCTLADGTNLNLYMWPPSDTADQKDYIYQTAEGTPNGCILQSDNTTGFNLASGNECIMGSTSGYLWFITLDITTSASSYAASLVPPIVSALHGQLMTHVPPSWCSVNCSPPTSPSTSSQSPSPSPSPSSPPPTLAPAPPAPAPTTSAGCYPLSNEGTCYEPGEFCRKADHGASGIAGDGKAITCEYNDGWRWEPS
jgi:hypothetical protein